jgi:hypothetical protein
MNEQEFDKRIREVVGHYESRDSNPPWNKKEVWNQIDAGLARDHTSWWKVAAVLLVLVSSFWSFAQWNAVNNLKRENAVEIKELQQQLDNMRFNQKELSTTRDLVLAQKNRELDSLRAVIQGNEELLKHRGFMRVEQDRGNLSEIPGYTEKHLIDSLQSQLGLVKVMLANLQVEHISVDTLPKQSEKFSVSKPVPARVIVLQDGMQVLHRGKGQGLKFHFPGNPNHDNIVYKSDHSIIKK